MKNVESKNIKRVLVTVLLAVSLSGVAVAQTGTAKNDRRQAAVPRAHSNSVQDRSFKSQLLGRETHYRILLPRGYAESTRRYPVLYLLHGLLGGYENWETRTNLTDYAASLPIIIVMPDARNSWYVNSANEPHQGMEDFIIQELIPEVDSRWRTIMSPHRRAIAGLSMGGYGALKFALKYPDMFGFAASISGAFSAPLDLESQREDFRDDLQRAFGPPESKTRTDNDVIRLAQTANTARTPYLYFDCGSSDFLLQSNRRLAAALSQSKVLYEYHELPGAHTWAFWDARLPFVLDAATKKIANGISPR